MDPTSRPTNDVADVILNSLDRMVAQLLDRLDGLDNAEYLWEPAEHVWTVRPDADGQVVVDGAGVREVDQPAPVPTIAWRLWHLAVDCFDDYTRRFAGDTSDAPSTWTLDADVAVRTLEQNWLAYRSTVCAYDWWDQLGPNWGHWAEHCVADMAMHASNELVHHGAEIALLRDLYANGAAR